MFSDNYTTVTGKAEGEFKDKGSRFIGYVYPVNNEQEVKQFLTSLKKEHSAAAHHCYAFVLGSAQQIQKSNDDREPSNTAGRPILRAILSRGLTNTLVVVVRYFGGKLLGVPGLIHAYGEAASTALANASIVEKTITEHYAVSGSYEHENELYRIYKQAGVRIISHEYNQNNFESIFEIRKAKALQVVGQIKEIRLFEIKFVTEQ